MKSTFKIAKALQIFTKEVEALPAIITDPQMTQVSKKIKNFYNKTKLILGALE